MAAPVVSSLLPASGLTLGETYVVITGTGFNDEASLGSIKVLFGGVEATEYGTVNTTTVVAVTPPGVAIGAVDVVVQNIGAGGAPVEPGTLVGGFEYKRPAIETKADKSTDCAILIVTRTLVSELRRTVLENVHWNMHPEYVDAVSALADEEVQSKTPSLKLVGPTIEEDRFYSLNSRFQVTTVAGTPGGGQFNEYVKPVTAMLTYQFVGVGRSKGEALNLWSALTRYFSRTPDLEVPQDGVDPLNGTLSFEMSVIWEQRGEFAAKVNRDGDSQFNGSVVIRGVHTVAGLISPGVTMDTEVILTTESIP